MPLCVCIMHHIMDVLHNLPRDDALKTSFAEYLAFSLIFLFILQVPHKFSCAPCPRCQKFGGARAPASCMVQAPMHVTQWTCHMDN